MKQYKYFHTSASWSSRGDGKYPACAAIVKLTPPRGGHSYVYSVSNNGENVCLACVTQPQEVAFYHAVYGPAAELRESYAFDYLRLRREGGVFEMDATDTDREHAGTDIEEASLSGRETAPVYSFDPVFYAAAVDCVLAGKTVVFKAGDRAEEFANALLRLFPRRFANTLGFITTPGSLSKLLEENAAGGNLDLRIIALGNYNVSSEDKRRFPAVRFLDPDEERPQEQFGAYAGAVLQFLNLTKTPKVLLEKFFEALSLGSSADGSALPSEARIGFACKATVFKAVRDNIVSCTEPPLTYALDVVKAYGANYPNGGASDSHREIGVGAAAYAFQTVNRYDPKAAAEKLSPAAAGFSTVLQSAGSNPALVKEWKQFLCRCIAEGVTLPAALKPAEILRKFNENDYRDIADAGEEQRHTVDSFKTLYEIAKVAGGGKISPEAARFLAGYADVRSYSSVFDPELAEDCGQDEEKRADLLAVLALSAVNVVDAAGEDPDKGPEYRDPARARFRSVCCACAKYGKDAPGQAITLWLKVCERLYAWHLKETPDAAKKAVGDAMQEMRKGADSSRGTTMNVLYGETERSPEEKLGMLFRLSDEKQFGQKSVDLLKQNDPDLYRAVAFQLVDPALAAHISLENYEQYEHALKSFPADEREDKPVRARIEEARLVAEHLDEMAESRRAFIKDKYKVLPTDKQKRVIELWATKKGTAKAGREDKTLPKEGNILAFVTDKERCERLHYAGEEASLVFASESLREVYNRYEPAPQPWSESRTHFLNCSGRDFLLSFLLGMVFAVMAAALLFVYPAVRAFVLGEELFAVAWETLHIYDLAFPVLAFFLFQIGFLVVLERRKRKGQLDFEAKERTRNAFWHAANLTFFVVIVSELAMIVATLAVYFLMPVWLSL